MYLVLPSQTVRHEAQRQMITGERFDNGDEDEMKMKIARH